MRLLPNLIHFTVLMRVSTQAMLIQLSSHLSQLLNSRSHLPLLIHSSSGSNLPITQNSTPMSTPSKPRTVSSQVTAHKTKEKAYLLCQRVILSSLFNLFGKLYRSLKSPQPTPILQYIIRIK